VAGHYLPLADNPGLAPESDQTRSLQSDQRTLQSRTALHWPLSPPIPRAGEGAVWLT
jgi:hypothetical protein